MPTLPHDTERVSRWAAGPALPSIAASAPDQERRRRDHGAIEARRVGEKRRAENRRGRAEKRGLRREAPTQELEQQHATEGRADAGGGERARVETALERGVDADASGGKIVRWTIDRRTRAERRGSDRSSGTQRRREMRAATGVGALSVYHLPPARDLSPVLSTKAPMERLCRFDDRAGEIEPGDGVPRRCRHEVGKDPEEPERIGDAKPALGCGRHAGKPHLFVRPSTRQVRGDARARPAEPSETLVNGVRPGRTTPERRARDDEPQIGPWGSPGGGGAAIAFGRVLRFEFVYDDRWTIADNLSLDEPLSRVLRASAAGTANAQGIPDATRPAMIASLHLDRRARWAIARRSTTCTRSSSTPRLLRSRRSST